MAFIYKIKIKAFSIMQKSTSSFDGHVVTFRAMYELLNQYRIQIEYCGIFNSKLYALKCLGAF